MAKKGTSPFDVTIGSYDGAETCELVGCFLLSQLQELLGHNIGLYRDDGLVISESTPKAIENIKKEMCRIFKSNGLRITIEVNKQIVNFLDVTFNLTNNTHHPYTKANTTLQYVHKESNHPPVVIKIYRPESTNASHPFHPTKHVLIKQLLHIRRPFMIAVISTLYPTRQ